MANEISGYQIIENTNVLELEKEVEAAIGEGWRPLGGVSLAVIYVNTSDAGPQITTFYAQALTLCKE